MASNGDTVMDPRLRAAALKRDLAALDRALDEGADPNAMDADGYTPLIFAVCNNNTDCVAKLIEAGAHPDCYTDKGRTPLNSAASSGYAETIRVLLAGGAQVDFIPPYYGSGRLTPLHYAIDFGHAQAIRELLAAGADANRRTESEFASDRVSPLFKAIKFSRRVANHSILPSLLRAGASINEPAVTEFFELLDETNVISPAERKVIEYVQAVHAAGSFPAYARGHRSMFAAIFSRGRRLPADVIPKIVEYWAHLGCYQYQVPGTGGTGSGTGSKKSNLPVGHRNERSRDYKRELRARRKAKEDAPRVGQNV